MTILPLLDSPRTFDEDMAKFVGLNEAIVLQQVHYWLNINRKSGRNYIDGRYWTYNSLPNWHEQNFSFWSFSTTKRVFARLAKLGYFITGNYNKDCRDKTLWYSIDYEKLAADYKEHKETIQDASQDASDEPMQDSILTDASAQNDPISSAQNEPMGEVKMSRPLPEISTETYTETSVVVVDPDQDQNNDANDTDLLPLAKAGLCPAPAQGAGVWFVLLHFVQHHQKQSLREVA